MESRAEILGFVPQNELIYNKALPYCDELDNESLTYLSNIKSNLGKFVLCQDIRDVSYWAAHLKEYIDLYGRKFSKEDHISFVKLMYELIIIPDISYCYQKALCSALYSLLKKQFLLTRDDLVMPWRPLYEFYNRTFDNPYTKAGLLVQTSVFEPVVKKIIRKCRMYFPVESTQEILDEIRPYMCPFSSDKGTPMLEKSLFYFDLFLTTTLPPEHHAKGYKLWFDELINIWLNWNINSKWENHLLSLFSRLARDNIGYIDWEPYIPRIFTKLLRSFNLHQETMNLSNFLQILAIYHPTDITDLVVSLLGKNSSCQLHITKLFRAVESYFHPSNHGRWLPRIEKFLEKLTSSLTNRLYREKQNKFWYNPIPNEYKLTNEEVTEFVKSVLPATLLSIYSKRGAESSAITLKNLAILRPELVFPPFLERLYSSLETVTEPHRLIASISCLFPTARCLVQKNTFFPEGQSHVIPLLMRILPGIDSNDIRKCLKTFQLLAEFANLVVIKDISSAVNKNDDLPMHLQEVCLATAAFEDFVLEFMDRLFMLIENSSLNNSNHLDRDSERKNLDEKLLETSLLYSFAYIVSSCSPEIHDVVLSKLHTFITTHIFEIHVSGKYAASLCHAVSLVNPERSLKIFIPHFTKLILALTESEEIVNEEKLDDELLFSLSVFNQVIVNTGIHLLTYQDSILKVLERALSLTCTEGYQLGCAILKHVLETYVSCYPEKLIHPALWSKYNEEEQHYYLDEWGKLYDIEGLHLTWHLPSEEELSAAKSVLKKILFTELDTLKDWISDKITLTKKQLRRSLDIVLHCVLGAGSALPMWQEEQYILRTTLLPHSPPMVFKCGSQDISIGEKNIRLHTCEVLFEVFKHISAHFEDDITALLLVAKIYNALLFHWGKKEHHQKDYDLTKHLIENKLYGKKKRTRSLLVDRVNLQHDLRTNMKYRYYFTKTHALIMEDLLKLSVSHYSDIRVYAQGILFSCLVKFYSSGRVIFDKVLEYLEKDPVTHHEEFKGILYVILGRNSVSLMTVQNLDFISKLWPTIVSSKHSEKPSILRMFSGLSNVIAKNMLLSFYKFGSVQFSTSSLSAAKVMFNSNSPSSNCCMPNAEEIIQFSETMENRGKQNESYVYQLMRDLVQLVNTGNLHWRHTMLASLMLSKLIRKDTEFLKEGVEVFVSHLTHDVIGIRTIAVHTVKNILMLSKQKRVKISIDPTVQNSDNLPLHPEMSKMQVTPLPDNFWLQYNSADTPSTLEKWNAKHFVHKKHWGFYAWPKSFEVYAPDSEQPKLNRTRDELSEQEKPIYDAFLNKNFVDKFLTLEESKEYEFYENRYCFYKMLFACFGDTFLPLVIEYLQSLSNDLYQKRSAELICAIMTGSKHWDFEKTHCLKDAMTPILEKTLSNITPDNLSMFNICFSTISAEVDANKYYWFYEFLMKKVSNCRFSSFLEASYLCILAAVLCKQSWRIFELLNRLISYIQPNLTQASDIVQEELGKLLSVIFFWDNPLPVDVLAFSPKQVTFLSSLLPHFEVLKNNFIQNGVTSILEESEEMKNAKTLLKIICTWLNCNIIRSLFPATPDIFRLLPLLCHMQNNNIDKSAVKTLSFIQKLHLSPESIESILCTLKEVVSSDFWHSRLTAATYLQVMVFSNLLTLMHNDNWTTEIHNIVFKLLEDERVEVRETAAETLCGFFHCEYLKITDELLEKFKKKIVKRNKALKTRTLEPGELVERHSGILGLCACVNAFPYEVPEFLPEILVLLGDHLHDPQPISTTIKKTFSSFRRTHYDNWRDHKLKFTDDQLVIITNLLVSPNYYA